MSESPSAGTCVAEGNKGGRSAGEESSPARGVQKGNLAVNLALSYSWLVVLMMTVCVDACPRKNEWGSTEAPAVGSARAPKEVPSVDPSRVALNVVCGRIVVLSWGRERDGNIGRRREDGGRIPLRTPKSDVGRGGDERMKRRRGLDGIRIHGA
jgi:hypothetical protein